MMTFKKIAFAIAAFMVVAPASVQAVAETKIVVIDQSRIMSESKAGKDVAAKVKNIAEQMNKELNPTLDALTKEDKSLKEKLAPLNQKAIMEDQALVSRLKSFQKRTQEFEVTRQTRARELELTRRDAWSKFYNALGPALQSVIDESKADIVIDRSSVVHAADDVDMTGAVIAKLDASTPTIAVTKQSLPAQ